MILKIRNSRIGKAMSLLMVFVFILTLNPIGGYALTGGPAQPEFNSFTPIGTSDMVDLASGDFSYNIPLMEVGGFPINLAYSSGVTMDQEASWVGLGWDLSIGQINRQMRGLPDDFDGDEMLYENNIKDNWTVGGTFQASPEAFGVKIPHVDNVISTQLKVSLTAQYNSYNGFSLNPSAGVTFDLAKMGSVGLNATSTPDGLSISPTVSLNPRIVNGKKRDSQLGASLGVSFNSRQGLTSVNMSTSTGTPSAAKFKQRRTLAGSSKSFVSNTYTPNIQANMQTLSGTFNAAYGAEIFGAEGEAEITGFFSNQFMVEKTETKRAYGYEHTHSAPKNAVLDFNREKDGNFTVNSTNLPLTNYTYDLYSVQGQGVGGMFQPNRSQVGYVFDNYTYNNSSDMSAGVEIGLGNAVHTGGDIQATEGETRTGLWSENNKPVELESFDPTNTESKNYEEVYFKNVGDLSADKDMDMYDVSRLGKYNPIRFNIKGGPYDRSLENEYLAKGESTSAEAYNIDSDEIKRSNRVNRNQNIIKINAEEAEMVGFIPHTYAKSHHTAGFIITRNDGARYNYGKALYNTTKREVTFAVGSGIGGAGIAKEPSNISTGLVHFDYDVDNSVDNKHGDQYFSRTTTPAYAHTFLLTSLVSTDYSDIDLIEGPSEGDLGSYTLFEYNDRGTYNWRIPFQKDSANFNQGLNTDPTDDKGSYVYGSKETSYIKKIETKTHVAIFYVSPRHDGYGVNSERGNNPHEASSSKMYKLDKILLFSRGEYYATGVTTDTDGNGNIIFTGSVPTPIKTVNFEYDYSLCPNVVNNDLVNVDGTNSDGGKLTLTKVYFTYRNSNMGRYSAYDFSYADIDHNGTVSEDENAKRNPSYNLKGYDIWGSYKLNPETDGSALDPLSAPEFNFVEQNNSAEEAAIHDNVAAWSITDISLPSGGKIQVDYESDDYQFVQNKKAMRMFKVAGAGDHSNPYVGGGQDKFKFEPDVYGDDEEAFLYKDKDEALYLYFELDEDDQPASNPSLTLDEFRNKYVRDIYNSQNRLVQFRMLLNMSLKGGKKNGSWEDEPFDYVSGYFELDNIDQCTYFTSPGVDGVRYGSIKMNHVDMEGGFVGNGGEEVNPISKAGWQFGRKYLSKFIYGGADVEGDGEVEAEAVLKKLAQSLEGLVELFAGANGLLKSYKMSKRFIPEKSWIRLVEPSTHKLGGGCRVKQIAMTDEWATMTSSTPGGIMDQKYGQEYRYELEDGGSSGVATYEPVGSKENPFVQPVFVNTNRLLAPDEENYTEKPFGESFFPSPQVTYSRVSVMNLERTDGDRLVQKHATGRVVTAFYTSKDFPVMVDQTKLQVEEDSNPLIASLLQVNIVKHLTLSQGYLVHLNDMNGKMRSQWVYGEDQDEPISGVEYKYDTRTPPIPEDFMGIDFNEYLDNAAILDNSVLTIKPSGHIAYQDLGVEYNIVNDFREMRSVTEVIGQDINAAFYTIGPLPIIVPVPLPNYSRHVDQLRIATTTKIVNSYGILSEVIAHDAGASVWTRNLAWDSETGEVLLTQTTNEYNDKYYSLNYPAHWYYKGMAQASFNNGLVTDIIPGAGSGNYKATDGTYAKHYFYPGDEVLIKDDEGYKKGWIDEISGTSNFSLIDEEGDDMELVGAVSLRVMRSGKRNIQSTSMGSIVLMKDPSDLFELYGDRYFFKPDAFDIDPDVVNQWKVKKIMNAGVVEFTDDWNLQCECIIDNIHETYNPYRYNMKGVWRAKRSHLYLTGRHHEAGQPDPRNEGFYTSYLSFYKIGLNGWEIPEESFENWTFTSEVTEYSPYGFELENQDALGRKSAAQYGYNNSFPLAVGANMGYNEIGFDGFEDYQFNGCSENEHFGFRTGEAEDTEDGVHVTNQKAHTGKHSLRVAAGTSEVKLYRIGCSNN